MTEKQRLLAGIRTIVKREMSDIVAVCKVVSVDSDLITVEYDGLDYFDLPIATVEGVVNTGYMLPVIGSYALCLLRKNGGSQVIAVSEVDSFELNSKKPILFATENESLLDIMTDLITAIEQLTVTTGVGPSGAPINLAQFTAVKQRLTNLLK